MKKFVILLSMMLIAAFSFGQYQMEYLEMDSTVRVGKLENGLTYFIKKNANPEKRAEFYIATNVGAINETPAQRGLAHFLEHMCFNGNKDFPGNTMLSYLEKNGLIFGANINAMTGVESTVYTLNAIPTDKQFLVDTALVVLQNDAAFVTNDFGEVEKERGVIIEEWRGGNTAQRRQQEALFEVLFKDSKYATCNVIGDEQCLSTFDPQELVNFYKTWYYPANQAIIVVGDVDMDYIESKIKEYFSIIPKKEQTPVKEKITVPDNAEPLVKVFTDPEIFASSFMLINKQPAMPKAYKTTKPGFLINVLKSLITSMANERFSDASKEPDAPFVQSAFAMTSLMEPMDGVLCQVVVKNNQNEEAVKKAVEMVRQIEKFGFTQEEFDRAKASMLRSYQSMEDKAATRNNRQLANQYVQYFLNNEPYCDPAYLNSLAKELLAMVNLDMVNRAVAQGIMPYTNNVVFFAAPQKEGVTVPTEEQLLSYVKEGYAAEVQPLKTEEIAKELLDPASIKDGKIKKSAKGYLDCTVWTLSNGVEVYLYPTDVNKDRVSIDFVQEGGRSILPAEIIPSFENDVLYFYKSNSGTAGFSESVLQKMLAGKSVGVSNYVNESYSGVSGSCSTKDIETAMQLLYLEYTQPRSDEKEFESTLSTMKVLAQNIESSPEYKFQQLLNRVENNNNPRAEIFSKEIVDKVNVNDIKKGHQILFGDAVGAKLYIVGDFDIETIKPFVEKYVASLPVKGKKARQIVDHKLYPASGTFDVNESVKMKNPAVYVAVIYNGEMQKTPENTLIMNAFRYIMRMRYLNSLREEDGGTYTPSATGSISAKPNQRYDFEISFNTGKDKVATLLERAYSGMDDMAKEGPTDEEMTKTIEMLKKNIPESKKQQSYWQGLLENYYNNNGYDGVVTDELIDKIVTKENIQALGRKIVENGNRITVKVDPQE